MKLSEEILFKIYDRIKLHQETIKEFETKIKMLEEQNLKSFIEVDIINTEVYKSAKRIISSSQDVLSGIFFVLSTMYKKDEWDSVFKEVKDKMNKEK